MVRAKEYNFGLIEKQREKFASPRNSQYRQCQEVTGNKLDHVVFLWFISKKNPNIPIDRTLIKGKSPFICEGTWL